MSTNVLQEPAPTPQPPQRHSNSGANTAIWIAIAVAVFSSYGHRCRWWKKKDSDQPTA